MKTILPNYLFGIHDNKKIDYNSLSIDNITFYLLTNETALSYKDNVNL